MNKKPNRHFSKLQEKYVAKIVRGSTTPNSGATPYKKGDVETYGFDSWLIECKTCKEPKLSFSIKKDWLRIAKQESIQQGKMNYAIAFNFGPNQPNYYIIDEDKFKQLFEEE